MVTGVIILETKNTFQVIGVDNKLKSEFLILQIMIILLWYIKLIKIIFVFAAVPKEQCIFELELEGYLIQLYGKHFVVRSKDRSKKKIKDNLILEL